MIDRFVMPNTLTEDQLQHIGEEISRAISVDTDHAYAYALGNIIKIISNFEKYIYNKYGDF